MKCDGVYIPISLCGAPFQGLGGADRDKLDPILDACVAFYKEQLDEDGQVDFKGKAKAFVRTYGFLASISGLRSRSCIGYQNGTQDEPGKESLRRYTGESERRTC
jgi:hypothetical protein